MDAMRQIGMMILNNQTGDIDPLQIRLATGVFGMANFVLQPLNLLIGYMLLKGMV